LITERLGFVEVDLSEILVSYSTVAQWISTSSKMLDLHSLGHRSDSHWGQLRSNLGLVVHTYVPLSISTITWYWSKDCDVLIIIIRRIKIRKFITHA